MDFFIYFDSSNKRVYFREFIFSEVIENIRESWWCITLCGEYAYFV